MRVRILLSNGGLVEGAVSDLDADTLRRLVKREAGPALPTWLAVTNPAVPDAPTRLVRLVNVAVLELEGA